MCKLRKSERNATHLSRDKKTKTKLCWLKLLTELTASQTHFSPMTLKDVASARNRLKLCGGCEEIMAKGRGVKEEEGGNSKCGAGRGVGGGGSEVRPTENIRMFNVHVSTRSPQHPTLASTVTPAGRGRKV